MSSLKVKYKSNKKLEEVILYIADKCKEDQYFGATKLNKILFLVDFNNYAIRGESITGSTYIHREFGPVPKELLPAMNKLEIEERARIEEVQFYDKKQKRVIPLSSSDTTILSTDELSLIDTIIESTEFNSGSNLSKWSHELLPYKITQDGEEIPYFTVYTLHEQAPTKEDIAWAKREIDRLYQL